MLLAPAHGPEGLEKVFVSCFLWSWLAEKPIDEDLCPILANHARFLGIHALHLAFSPLRPVYSASDLILFVTILPCSTDELRTSVAPCNSRLSFQIWASLHVNSPKLRKLLCRSATCLKGHR
jgi:hypothetical protein